MNTRESLNKYLLFSTVVSSLTNQILVRMTLKFPLGGKIYSWLLLKTGLLNQLLSKQKESIQGIWYKIQKLAFPNFKTYCHKLNSHGWMKMA